MRILVLTFLLTLTACSALFGIKSQFDDSGNIQIAIDSKNMFGFHSKQPTDYFSVYYLDGESTVEVWRLSAPNNSVRLGWVTYGKVPEGFTEEVKAKDLILGKEYHVIARGPGWSGGGKFNAAGI
ncbi:hypothetical protein [Microbulbifer aestuariivivens]|uniref:hypothetical protein n=1 Tax=Microbulbifer aestuariivivens TaxID=1908308 RepID=UPI0031E68AD8